MVVNWRVLKQVPLFSLHFFSTILNRLISQFKGQWNSEIANIQTWIDWPYVRLLWNGLEWCLHDIDNFFFFFFLIFTDHLECVHDFQTGAYAAHFSMATERFSLVLGFCISFSSKQWLISESVRCTPSINVTMQGGWEFEWLVQIVCIVICIARER